jgi:hypothetical protein
MNAEEFVDHSVEFLEAAKKLKVSKPFLFKPTFYCAIHSIELALKGHLIHQKFSPEKLRRRAFGHNIDNLLEQALIDGALDDSVINFHDQKAIKWGSDYYAGKCFEYPELMYSTHPIGKWIMISEKLIKNLREKIKLDGKGKETY